MYGSEKIVVLDSVVSVMKDLIVFKKLGVFAHAVTRKDDIGRNLDRVLQMRKEWKESELERQIR